MQRDLVVRAQAGDVDAFSALTFDSTKRLHATARLILRDDEAAKDAVQDALLEAWLNLRGLRDPDRFDAWLHRLRASLGPSEDDLAMWLPMAQRFVDSMHFVNP